VCTLITSGEQNVRILTRVALENKLYYLTISYYFTCQQTTSLVSKKTSQNTREISISEVQTNPSLWNDTHPEYINREINKKKLVAVGKIIGLTGIIQYNINYFNYINGTYS